MSRISQVSRSLLRATRHIPLFESNTLGDILLNIFTEIELYTTWSRAVFHRVVIALRNGLHKTLENTKRPVTNPGGKLHKPTNTIENTWLRHLYIAWIRAIKWL